MTNDITHIDLEEKALLRNQHFKHDRDRVITDLTKESLFQIQESQGPYTLKLKIAENKVIFTIINNQEQQHNVTISLQPLRSIIKDYSIVCNSYMDAVKTADSKKIEAIDMGRRGLHNEGAEILNDLLTPSVTMDFETARKFFSLIYILQQK